MSSARHPRKRILLVSIFYAPEPIGISKYAGELGAWLTDHDCAVRVVTAFPFYPQWRLYPGYPAWRYHRERLDGVEVVRCPLWVPRRVSGAKRVLHLASFALSSLPATLAQLRWKPDVVLAIMPTLLNIPAALVLARLAKSRSWLWVQDFEFDLAFGLDLLSDKRWLANALQHLERNLIKRFDRVATISHRMVERLIQEKEVSNEQVYLLPNWVAPDAIFPTAGPNPFRRELDLRDDQVVVLYSGNMGRKYGLEVLADAAQQLAHRPDVVFVMCGDGAARGDLEAACRDLSNVQFLPLQPEERLNDLLNLADVHVLPQRGNVADSVMPSKLLGMLASGRPVVATVAPGTEVANVVQHCGLVVPPDNAGALADAALSLASDGTLREQLGQAGRRLVVERFSKDVVLGAFLEQVRAAPIGR